MTAKTVTSACSFEKSFTKDYEKQLNMTYESSDKEWFTEILKRELEVKDMLIHKDDYKGETAEQLSVVSGLVWSMS